MELSEMEILYLLRLVSKHIEELERRLERNRRYFSNPDDDVLYYKKVGVLEDEHENMVAVRDKLKIRIAASELWKSFYQGIVQSETQDSLEKKKPTIRKM